MLKVDPEWIELAARSADAIPDPKLREMMVFAKKCAREPQSLGAADYGRLRTYGLSDREILEIVSMAGVAVYANVMADATGMEADEMFSNFSPAAKSAVPRPLQPV